MQETLCLYMVFVVLGFLSGFIVSLIGGGGGLILISGLSFLFVGMFPDALALKLAIGTSIALFPVISISALLTLSRLGQGWERSYFYRALPFIVIGAFIGPRLTIGLPATVLHPVIGLLLLSYGLSQLAHGQPTALRESAEPINLRISLIIGATSLFAAVIAGAAGVAIGVFLIPCLARYLPYRQAITTSISAAVPSTFIGAATYALSGDDLSLGTYWHLGYVYIPAFLVMLPATLVGVISGGMLTVRLPVDWLRRAFYLYVIIAGAIIGLQ